LFDRSTSDDRHAACSKEGFLNQVLWPEFQELHAELARYLNEVTTRLIREEVHSDTSEAPDGSQHIT